MKILAVASTFAGMLFVASPSTALELLLDYTHDASTDNFFNTHPVARASLERARDDIQEAITSVLAGIATDTVSGTNGATTANYNFRHTYTNPSTGAAQSISLSTLAPDRVTVFVGMRGLSGSTLGQGGPGAAAVSITGGGNPSEWPGAMNAANAAGTVQRMRGTGPHISTISSTVSLGGVSGTLSVDCGASVSHLWFDVDTDNNSVTDTDSTLNAAWHFDWSTPVAPGKSDFYSVALHELLHGLGMGTSQAWTNNVSGSDWLGAEAISLYGTGTGLVNGGHITSVTSPRLSDGVAQEVVMSGTLTTGTRKTLTELDLAFLRDINWQTIPEPSGAGLSLVAAALLFRRRRD